jgi:hypothetical protein
MFQRREQIYGRGDAVGGVRNLSFVSWGNASGLALAKAREQGGDHLRWAVIPPLQDIGASVSEVETACDHGALGGGVRLCLFEICVGLPS